MSSTEANKPGDSGHEAQGDKSPDRTGETLLKASPEADVKNYRAALAANPNRTDTVSPDGKSKFALTDKGKPLGEETDDKKVLDGQLTDVVSAATQPKQDIVSEPKSDLSNQGQIDKQERQKISADAVKEALSKLTANNLYKDALPARMEEPAAERIASVGGIFHRPETSHTKSNAEPKRDIYHQPKTTDNGPNTKPSDDHKISPQNSVPQHDMAHQPRNGQPMGPHRPEYRGPLNAPHPKHEDPTRGAFIHQPPKPESLDHGALIHRPPAKPTEHGAIIHKTPGEPSSISHGQPQEPGEIPENEKSPAGGEIIMGGHPPPDPDGNNIWNNPDFDPEHGTGSNFARKHLIMPEGKNPQAPVGDKKEPEKTEENEKDKNKNESDSNKSSENRLFAGSGFKDPIYYNQAEDKYMTQSETARRLETTWQKVSKMSPEELAEKGLKRLEIENADFEIAKKLEKAVVEKVEIGNDGKITKESGLKACDEIREILRPVCKDIDSKNIAFAIVEIDGHRQIVIALNRDVPVPGTLPTIPESKVFQPDLNPAFPRKSDSENKILEKIGQAFATNGEGTVKLFSEQEPCPDSCQPIIKDQFPAHFKGRIDLTESSVYKTEKERWYAVKKRVETKNNAN